MQPSKRHSAPLNQSVSPLMTASEGQSAPPVPIARLGRAWQSQKWLWAALAPVLCLSFAVLHGTRNDMALLYPNQYSDHFSHHQATVLFLLRGLAVYRPILEVCNTPEDLSAHQPPVTAPRQELRDSCYLRERPDAPPLKINWSQFPRPYPLGLFLYTLPEALLFATNLADFGTVNRITIGKYLLGSLVLAWALGMLFFMTQRPPPGSDVATDLAPPGARKARKRRSTRSEALPLGARWLAYARAHPMPLAGIVLLPFCTEEAFKWAFCGFYDNIAVAFAVLAGIVAARRRWVDAILLISLGIFLHFRMLWYMPLLGYCAIAWLREVWQAPTRFAAVPRGDWVKVTLSAMMLLTSFAVMVTISPYLKQFPLTNWLQNPNISEITHRFFWAPIIALMVWHVIRRDFLQAVNYGWIAFMLAQTQQFQWWHTLSLIPLWAVAYVQGGQWRHVVSATVFVYCTTFYAFFYTTSFDWLRVAWHNL